jgi:hypothetical protein
MDRGDDLIQDKGGGKRKLTIVQVHACSTNGLVQRNVGNMPPKYGKILATPDPHEILSGDEEMKITLGTFEVAPLDLRLDPREIVCSHILLFGLPPDYFSEKVRKWGLPAEESQLPGGPSGTGRDGP